MHFKCLLKVRCVIFVALLLDLPLGFFQPVFPNCLPLVSQIFHTHATG